MDSKYILTKELSKLQQQEAELRLSYDQKVHQIRARRETILSDLLPDYCPSESAAIRSEPASTIDSMRNATDDTGSTSTSDLSDINEDDFDVILDMTTTSLRYRQDPARHTKLKDAQLTGIGRCRIDILAYLLEHPSRNLSIENASLLPSQDEIIEPNTLSKTISLLRKALGQKGSEDTYIVTCPVWDKHYRSAYRANTKWRYLVIREKKETVIKKS